MPATRNLTLRLPEEDYLCIETLAEIDETTVSDLIREAIGDYIEKKASDAAMESLKRHYERKAEALAARIAS